VAITSALSAATQAGSAPAASASLAAAGAIALLVEVEVACRVHLVAPPSEAWTAIELN